MQGERPNLAQIIRSGATMALEGGEYRLSDGARATLRSLQWRNKHRLDDVYPYTFEGPESLKGVTIQIAQRRQGEQKGLGTGAVVWDGAVILMKYLEKLCKEQEEGEGGGLGGGPDFLAGKSVIELGAGTGAVGLAAAALGAKRVAITDVEEILFLTRENVVSTARTLAKHAGSTPATPSATFESRVHTFSYSWGTESEQLRAGAPYDLVLIAECIVPRLYPIEPLVEAVAQLIPAGCAAQAFITYEHRHHHEFHPAERFEQLLQERGFMLRSVPAEQQDSQYTLPDVELWCVMRADAPTAILDPWMQQMPPRGSSSGISVVASSTAEAQLERSKTRVQEDRLRSLLSTVWPGRNAAVIKGLQKLQKCGVDSVEALRAALVVVEPNESHSTHASITASQDSIDHANFIQIPDDLENLELTQRLRQKGYKTFSRASVDKMVQWLATDTPAQQDIGKDVTRQGNTAQGLPLNVATEPIQSVQEAMDLCFGNSGSESDSESEVDSAPLKVDIDPVNSVEAAVAACFGDSSDGDSDSDSSNGDGQGSKDKPSGAILTALPTFANALKKLFESLVDLRAHWLKVSIVVLAETTESFSMVNNIVQNAGHWSTSLAVNNLEVSETEAPHVTATRVLAETPFGCDVLIDLRAPKQDPVQIFGNLYSAVVVPGGASITSALERFCAAPMTRSHYFWAIHGRIDVAAVQIRSNIGELVNLSIVHRRSVLANPLWPLRPAPVSDGAGSSGKPRKQTGTESVPLLPRRARVTPRSPVAVFKDVKRIGTTHGTGVELPPGVDGTSFVDILAPSIQSNAGDPRKQSLRFWERPEEVVEMELLEKVTVAGRAGERQTGRLSKQSLAKAATALREHGVCILRGAFDPSSVRRIAQQGRLDLATIEQRLEEKCGVNLRDPARSTAFNSNFVELAMREPRRCDVHRSPRLLAENMLIRASARVDAESHPKPSRPPALQAKAALQPTDEAAALNASGPSVSHAHPDVIHILREVCNPPGGAKSAGNWGRWNFGGPGPSGPPDPLTAGDIGVIFSFPGAADQSFHADTPHLYEHLHLPPHYVDLFMPDADGVFSDPEFATHSGAGPSDADGVSSPAALALEIEPCLQTFKVGQTAFVCGSHRLECSARVCYHESSAVARREFDERTICPHLRTGDALLFDTRTLHFGLGNLKNGVASADASTGGSDGASSSNVNVCWRQTGPDRTRALLYINYWQPWWDKNTDKNWGQSELFNDEDRNAAVTEAQQRLLGISL